MSNQYIFAVARIRKKEQELLTSGMLEQLIAQPDEEHCLTLLHEQGYGEAGQDAGGNDRDRGAEDLGTYPGAGSGPVGV